MSALAGTLEGARKRLLELAELATVQIKDAESLNALSVTIIAHIQCVLDTKTSRELMRHFERQLAEESKPSQTQPINKRRITD